MIFKSILRDKGEATELIETFSFPEDFLKVGAKCLSQISSDMNEFPAAFISIMVYCMFLSSLKSLQTLEAHLLSSFTLFMVISNLLIFFLLKSNYLVCGRK